jgi:Flp pilus assembly protein TadD
MKKLIFSGLLLSLTFLSLAQVLPDKLIIEGYKKEKEKSDKDIQNPKANIKAKTWLDRAKTHENIAIYALSIDSSAAQIAYDAYKKVAELDVKNGKPGSQAKEAQTALSSKPLFNAFLQTGAGNYTNKNYAKAQQAFKMANAIDPKDSVATMYYGVASQQLQDDASTIEAYEKHIALAGKDPIVFYALFSAYRKQKNDDKAMAILAKGIQANPENKDLKAEQTNFYISSGKINEAISSLEEMIAKDSKNVNTILNLAILHDNAASEVNREVKKLSESISQGSDVQNKLDSKTSQVQAYTDERNRLKDQLKKQPKNADVKRRLGEAETFLKEQTDVLNKLKAEKVEEDAKKVDAKAVEAKISELVIKRDISKNAAADNYKKALAVEPNNYDANYNLGVMHFNDGVVLKAPYDNLNPTSSEFKNNGKAMEQQFINKFMEALPYFETAYKAKKEDEITENLKNLYRILKMDDKLKAMGE